MAELEEVAEVAAEIVADGADELASTATDFAEGVRNLSALKVKFTMLGAAFGLAAGAAIGWKVAYKRLEAKFEKIAEDEIDDMREHFRQRLVAKETKPDLDAEYKEQVKPYAGDVPRTPQGEEITVEPATPQGIADAVRDNEAAREGETPPEETRNVFEDTAIDPATGWNFEAEKAARVKNPGVPYVIHQDEYGEEDDHDQITLTYYGGDDVLADAKDKPVEDQDRVVGLPNLDRFGHGSGDSSIVYIRNDDLGVDIEVTKSEKTYAEEVHGFSHSDLPRRTRRHSMDE